MSIYGSNNEFWNGSLYQEKCIPQFHFFLVRLKFNLALQKLLQPNLEFSENWNFMHFFRKIIKKKCTTRRFLRVQICLKTYALIFPCNCSVKPLYDNRKAMLLDVTLPYRITSTYFNLVYFEPYKILCILSKLQLILVFSISVNTRAHGS